jgi:hypothetical protein
MKLQLWKRYQQLEFTWKGHNKNKNDITKQGTDKNKSMRSKEDWKWTWLFSAFSVLTETNDSCDQPENNWIWLLHKGSIEETPEFMRFHFLMYQTSQIPEKLHGFFFFYAREWEHRINICTRWNYVLSCGLNNYWNIHSQLPLS